MHVSGAAAGVPWASANGFRKLSLDSECSMTSLRLQLTALAEERLSQTYFAGRGLADDANVRPLDLAIAFQAS